MEKLILVGQIFKCKISFSSHASVFYILIILYRHSVFLNSVNVFDSSIFIILAGWSGGENTGLQTK